MEGLCSRRKQRHMTLLGTEFLRRFFMHVLPKGFRQNPLFWFSRQSIPHALPPALPATTGERSPASLYFLRNSLKLALPALRVHHGGHPETHRR
jgi:hypothetical protein